MGKLMQFVGSIIICNLCSCMGLITAWPSSTLRLFESANTTLTRPMSQSELALFGSLSSIGALIATPIAGVLMDRIGRKNSVMLSSLLAAMGWAIIASTTQVELVLGAMFICGLNGTLFLIVPIYVIEICEESIRGAMCSGATIFNGLGILVSYLLGGCLEYKVMIYVSLTLTTISALSLTLMKESPVYLMMKGMEKEASATLAFYRRQEPDSKEVQDELNTIRRSLNPELDELTPEEETQLKPLKQGKENIGLRKFIRKSRSTRSAMYMSLILVTASIFQGSVVVQVYAEPLFEEALPSMSPNVCSLILGVVGIVSGVLAAYLTERAGRRPLMIYASFISGASCLILGIQLHLHWGPSWLIAVNIYFFTMVCFLGASTVPYVLIAEVFLPEVKSFMPMLAMEWAWFCNSIVLFIFNPLLKAIGLGPVFYLFAGVSVLTGIYSIFFVPETKGSRTRVLPRVHRRHSEEIRQEKKAKRHLLEKIQTQ